MSEITRYDPLWNTNQVASYMNVHKNTVKRIPSHQLPFVRVTSRGDRRYRRSDVEHYLERMTRGE